VSDNVADILAAKLHRLPSKTERAIELCSVLGPCFDYKAVSPTVHAVLDYPKQDVDTYLSQLVGEGLLDSVNHGVVKFVHDKVYQAAFSEQKDHDSLELHLKIGLALLTLIDLENDGYSNIQDRRTLFMCTNNLNHARSLIVNNKDQQMQLAKLNLVAYKEAASLSAFVPATKYIEIAVSCLGDSETASWSEEYYDLTLDIYTLLAEMSLVSRKTEQLHLAVTEILKHGNLNIMDEVPAYVVAIEELVARGLHD
jgi:predicted ATPase